MYFASKQGPIWPLVPRKLAKVGMSIMNNKQDQKEIEVTIGKDHIKSEAEEMQLPIERLMPFPLLQEAGVQGKEACALCEYLLHYIQDTITNPTNEVTNIKILIFIYWQWDTCKFIQKLKTY